MLCNGTPSLVKDKFIYKILDKAYQKFNVELEEMTIESNPKTLNRNKLLKYKEMGINRISMGVQSLDNRILKDIGRIHNVEDFMNTYYLIKEIGFKNINADIMFNLPDQTLENMLDTLKKIVKLDIPHISFYSLKLEEQTEFYKRYLEGKLNLPNEDIERDMYHKGIELLELNDIYQYEISNFAKKGFECKHNVYYWALKPYIGLGISSHSNMFDKRWGNTTDYNIYKKNIINNKFPIEDTEIIDKDTKMLEYMILGLRLKEGISEVKFKQKFNNDIYDVFGKAIKCNESHYLLKRVGHNICLTKKGFDLSNIVFKEFI
ncbi:radical SAM family heme chaperone HemW [Clostridium sp. D2Q-14]|uniref:radical SAM family heme chaperone HemW n=1 Tax=Anaeromonas gelatinilytica TaxID=2683194 RepID=UPI00193BEE77|nr:radical SAM family heme chaperone HemW [Anaeromonas gelatinilytica]